MKPYISKETEEVRRREKAIEKHKCPDCGSRLRWMPSPIDRKKLTFCDNPLCDFQKGAEELY